MKNIIFQQKQKKQANEMDAGRAKQIVRFMFGKWSEEKTHLHFAMGNVFIKRFWLPSNYTDNIKQLRKELSFRYDMQIFFQIYRSNCIRGQITACPFV